MWTMWCIICVILYYYYYIYYYSLRFYVEKRETLLGTDALLVQQEVFFLCKSIYLILALLKHMIRFKVSQQTNSFFVMSILITHWAPYIEVWVWTWKQTVALIIVHIAVYIHFRLSLRCLNESIFKLRPC